MINDSIKAELARLRAEIATHRKLYYDKSAPEISDVDYDALEARLQDLENQVVPRIPGFQMKNTAGECLVYKIVMIWPRLNLLLIGSKRN